MPANLFPRPENLDWGKFRTFGYPWHGKWEQKQVNGVWKDTLTLKSEHDGEETPAPVDENGDARIPKLPSGAHLIDVQMPWAAQDLSENTPDNIRALGGKYWNRALFSPGNPAYLYGKSIGPADALYGAPDGSIWAYCLTCSDMTWARTENPGQGLLYLMMRRVAGTLTQNLQAFSPWIEVPLTGAQSLATLYPDIVAETDAVIAINPSFLPVSWRNVLSRGDQNYFPAFTFYDALPDGSRALYGVRVLDSREGAGDQRRFKNFPGASVLFAVLQLYLEGTPSVNMTARVVDSYHPGDLHETREDIAGSYDQWSPIPGVGKLGDDPRGTVEYTGRRACTLSAQYNQEGDVHLYQLVQEGISSCEWAEHYERYYPIEGYDGYFDYVHVSSHKTTTGSVNTSFNGIQIHSGTYSSTTEGAATPGGGGFDAHGFRSETLTDSYIGAPPAVRSNNETFNYVPGVSTALGGYVVQLIMTGEILNALAFLNVETPTVFRMISISLSEPLYNFGVTLTVGDVMNTATTQGSLPDPFNGTVYLPYMYTTWCPIRDELLITTRPSAWV